MRYSFPTLLGVLAFLASTSMQAILPEWLEAVLPDGEVVGSGRVSHLVWDLYDVELVAPNGEYAPEQPFALRLHYLRNIAAERIVQASMDEMRRQRVSEVSLAKWHEQLKGIFPDIKKGDVITGVFRAGQATEFYDEQGLIGTVNDPAFGPHFSDIWLGRKARYPDVRDSLKGRQ